MRQDAGLNPGDSSFALAPFLLSSLLSLTYLLQNEALCMDTVVHQDQTPDFGGSSSGFCCCCTADSQADDQNQLINNQKIDEFPPESHVRIKTGIFC